MLTMWIKVKTN